MNLEQKVNNNISYSEYILESTQKIMDYAETVSRNMSVQKSYQVDGCGYAQLWKLYFFPVSRSEKIECLLNECNSK